MILAFLLLLLAILVGIFIWTPERKEEEELAMLEDEQDAQDLLDLLFLEEDEQEW